MTRRDAFTLIEVMIVLTIVVSFMAIAWPRMRGLANKTQLRQAAVDFEAACAEMRDRAVRFGLPTVIRYRLGQSKYQLSDASAPAVDRDNMVRLESANLALQDSQRERPTKTEFELPPGVLFVDPAEGIDEPTSEIGETSDDDLLVVGPNDEEAEPIDWSDSASITFYPDGRATTATIRILATDTGDSIQVVVRGFTGGVAVGPVERPIERMPDQPVGDGESNSAAVQFNEQR